MTMHTEGITDREVLARLVHDETGEAEEESGFVADAILAAGFRRSEASAIAQAKAALSRALSRKQWREDGWEAPAIDVQEALDALSGSEVPEPSAEDEFAPGECDGSGTCPAQRHIHGCYTVHRADQCDAPEEYGHLSAEPQGEPSVARFRGIVSEVIAEAERSIAKHGEQGDLPMGTGPETYPLATDGPAMFDTLPAEDLAEIATADTKYHSRNEGGNDTCTWWHILREEVFEAAAESNPGALREELVQVATVAVKMIDALDAAGGVR